MIVKMKKYTFLVYHKDYQYFLESLQEKGVLHVKDRGAVDVEGGPQRDKLLLMNHIQEAIKFFEKKIDKKKISDLVPIAKGSELLKEYDNYRHDDELLRQAISIAEKEASILEPWGSIDWNEIDKLSKNGWITSFYSTSVRNWNSEWETKYNAFQISQNGTNLLFVTLMKEGVDLEVEADKVKLPRKVFKEVREEIEGLQKEKIKIDNELSSFASSNLLSLIFYKNQVQQEFDFDKVVLNSDRAAEGKISLLEGFLPVDKEVAFQEFLNNEGVFYEASKPEMTDKVPVLLKNNWFAKLFEPIGALYTLPNYHELDLTALYAPFYWLFFGFCLGDLGYGLILSIGGFIMSGRVKPSIKGVTKLISFLGLSTILFGVLSGTCFGMNLYEMRLGFYANLDDLLKSKDTSVNKLLFDLSLMLGAIQIFYGMFVKAANEIYQNGWRSALSTIGWIVIIFGFGINYLMKKSAVDPLIISIVFSSILLIGFLGAFIFNNPDRNIFSNMAFGLWDTYNMATGLMGDLLSYIRLFALAISSGILGYVFNSLAIAMAPDIPVMKYIVIVLILIAGHTINFSMGILGSFVHPMRLTFVEFYKNSGFSGGGKKYAPFKRRIE